MNMGRILRNLRGRAMDLIHGGEEKDSPWATSAGDRSTSSKVNPHLYGGAARDLGEERTPRGENPQEGGVSVEEGGEGAGNKAIQSPQTRDTSSGEERLWAGEGKIPGESTPENGVAPGESPRAPQPPESALVDLPAVHESPRELLDANAPELNTPVSSAEADAETDALFLSLREGSGDEERFIAPADEMVQALNSYNNTLSNSTFFLEDAEGTEGEALELK